MANVIEVLIKGIVSEDFRKALEQAAQSVEGLSNKIGQSVENINKRFEGMNKGFEALGRSMVGIGAALSIGITAPTVALASGAIEAAAKIEKLTIAFQPLLGSATAANARMKELQQFANATPFELPEVAQASRLLEVLTKGALATGDALRMVGDIASGTSQRFEDVAMWVGRLYDGLKSGRPVGEATMRLQEMGAMSGDVRNKVEQMALSGAKFSDTWKVVADSFGRFSGGMELQANSVSGKFSTLQDSGNTALAALGRSFEDVTKKALDFATAVTDKLGAMAEAFGRLPEPIRMAVLVVAALAAAIGPLLVAFGGLLLALPGLIAGWAALVPLIGAATTAISVSALAMVEWVTIAAVVGASLYKIIEAIKAAIEWWNAYKEASKKEEDADKATSDALERRAVGLEHRKALRKAGYDVGVGSETSQSQGMQGFAEYKAAEEAKAQVAKDAAAKVHEEFVKTDRASLIAAENKKFEEQKAALGGNVEALKELNKLHQDALDKINKKAGYKAPKEESIQSIQAGMMLEVEEERRKEALKLKIRDDALKADKVATEKWYKEEERLQAERSKAFDERIERMKTKIQPLLNVAQQISQGFGNVARSMTDLALRGDFSLKKLGQAFKNLMISMISDLVGFVAKTIAEVLLLKALDFMTGGMVSAVLGATSMKSGGGGFMSSPAQSFGQGAFSFDVGTPSVPRDMLAMVHQGEMIVPKTFAQGMRDGEVPMGGGGHSASLVLGKDIINALKNEGSALVKITKNQQGVSFA